MKLRVRMVVNKFVVDHFKLRFIVYNQIHDDNGDQG
ncbi:unnamed protein product [Brassica oleracea]